MAERPVYAPDLFGAALVREVGVSFRWHPGMAPTQKKKNIAELHNAASRQGLSPILEVSSKSDSEIGQQLSSFHLLLWAGGRETTVECAFQASKVFEGGGPYTDLLEKSSREAKRDERLRSSGRLTGFEFCGDAYPLFPVTAFYDWLYINALYSKREWLKTISYFKGFTDIEFNPNRSLNCQARSLAMFFALQARNELDDAIESFGAFVNTIYSSREAAPA
jgi:hypothetical protein